MTEKNKRNQTEKMDAQLKQWGEKIDQLAAKLGKSGLHEKNLDQKRIGDLKLKRIVAQTKLDEYKAAGSEHWDAYKTDIWIAWSDMEVAFEDLEKLIGSNVDEKNQHKRTAPAKRIINTNTEPEDA